MFGPYKTSNIFSFFLVVTTWQPHWVWLLCSICRNIESLEVRWEESERKQVNRGLWGVKGLASLRTFQKLPQACQKPGAGVEDAPGRESDPGLPSGPKQGAFVSTGTTHCLPSAPLLYHSQNFLYYLPLFIILPREYLISSLDSSFLPSLQTQIHCGEKRRKLFLPSYLPFHLTLLWVFQQNYYNLSKIKIKLNI